MKIANDIRSIFEDDAKKLTEAFLTGEIKAPLSEMADQSDVHAFAADILRFQFDSSMLSLIIPFLGTMKWLSLDEACIYARKSRNTILELIIKGDKKGNMIYGTKGGGGEWIVDRESIDAYYNEERLALQEKLRHLRRAS